MPAAPTVILMCTAVDREIFMSTWRAVAERVVLAQEDTLRDAFYQINDLPTSNQAKP